MEIHQVNPAYSSVIGRVKFMERYGLTVHQAAALVLARRMLGCSDAFFENHQNRWYPSNTRVILGGVEWADKFGNLSRRLWGWPYAGPTDSLTVRRCERLNL